MTPDDYYVLVIIISIISVFIIVSFAIYFLYLPATKANNYFNALYNQGAIALDRAEELAQNIDTTNIQVQAFIVGICNFNDDLSPLEKPLFWGTSFDEFCSDLGFGQ